MMKRWIMVVAMSVGAVGGVFAQTPGQGAPSVPPPPTKPPPPPPQASGASAELKVGTGIEKRVVTGEATSFPKGTTVYVWSRIHDVDGSVTHVWKRDGQEAWTKELPVGSHQWSTFSRRTIATPGAWQVEVKTADGASLGTIDFTIE